MTAGTVLHRTRTPLAQWFSAAYLVTTHTPGLSPLQLQRQLGIRRSETAWTILHKLRRAMVRPGRDLLRDKVEVDESCIGGPEIGLRGGRQLGHRARVVAAIEVRGAGSGRARLKVVPDATAASLSGFVKANLATGAIVWTDAWQGYAPLRGLGYRHHPRTQGDPRRANRILPRVYRVFGGLQTRLRGTHHGVSAKHLQAYLDEFTFRFDRRHTPMAAFQTLLGLGNQQSATTCNQSCGVEYTA